MLAELDLQVKVDEDIFDLIPGFLLNQSRELQRLQQALAEGDLSTIRRIGHRIRGTGQMYGFGGLGVLGQALETTPRPEELPELVETLGHYLAQVRYSV